VERGSLEPEVQKEGYARVAEIFYALPCGTRLQYYAGVAEILLILVKFYLTIQFIRFIKKWKRRKWILSK
jgi:hypothetical protein